MTSLTDAGRISVIVTKQWLLLRFLTTHKLEFQTSVVHVTDDAQNDESSLDVLRKCDHGEFAVVARISHCQIEVGEVDDVVVGFGLLVEKPDFRWSTYDVVCDDAFDEDGFDSVDFPQIDADVSECFLLAAPTCH